MCATTGLRPLVATTDSIGLGSFHVTFPLLLTLLFGFFFLSRLIVLFILREFHINGVKSLYNSLYPVHHFTFLDSWVHSSLKTLNGKFQK